MADIFDVIADGTRRDLLQVLLERGEVSVSEMVERLEISQPTVSKHLKVLRDHDLVGVREDGQHRYYRLQGEALEEVEDWLIPFLSADFDESDAAGAAVFAAWSGAEVGESVGRRLAEGRSAIGTLPKRIRRRLFRR
jgi:DNA-binding transcriptional ArsR family regulator